MTRWTDTDLEAYHDGELPRAEREALTSDLFTDSALRARLASLRTLDRLAAEALAGAPRLPEHSTSPMRLRAVWLVAGAAAAAAMAALGVWISAGAVKPAAPLAASPVERAAEPSSPDARAESEGLLLAVVPARASAMAPLTPPAPADRAERVGALIDRGDLAAALDALRERPAADAFIALGERLRSGDAAREILATLSPDQQVEACEAWAAAPSLRYVAFDWLSRLARGGDRETADAIASLRDRLAQNPDLKPWLASYSLR